MKTNEPTTKYHGTKARKAWSASNGEVTCWGETESEALQALHDNTRPRTVRS